ncbi:hypothetical protein FQN50_008183 [Emmonsiellopsis sp. PD_5]|nr:hypothetical protein FQN50_008183 [Emmonsiellopsis sp. PD_5]
MRWFQGTLVCAITAALGSTGVGAHVMLGRGQEETPAVTSATEASVTPSPTTTTDAPTTTTTDAPTTTTEAAAPAAATKVLGDPDDNGVFPAECHAENEPFKPFCLPVNGSDVYAGDIYFVTWDSDMMEKNSTIIVGLNYFNSTGNGGINAHTSDRIENSFGSATITMDKAWLQEEKRNNLTMFILEYDPDSDERPRRHQGPVVSLVNRPAKHYPAPDPTPVPNKLGLAVGLPVGLGVIFLISLGLCFGMRKSRRIGLGNIMGRRAKGYGSGKSRIERLGGRKRRGGNIRLGELDDPAVQYRDEPSGNRFRSETEIFNESERTRGNVFRDDVSRLKNWR